MPAPAQVTKLILELASAEGFHRAGVAPATARVRYRAFRRWLADGKSGSMAFLSAPHQLAARRDLGQVARDARTVVTVALAYDCERGDNPQARIPGFVARYARGTDYHVVLRQKLSRLGRRLADELGRTVGARPCVDSAPVLERDLAEASGIGFVGKNTMLIAPGLGSYIVLGELLLDIAAEPTGDANQAAEPTGDKDVATRCGSCTACLDACPTGAFDDAFVLDARRCISYLTIEHRGTVPRSLRASVGNMVFGCDICQEVCPYNAAAPARTPPAPELACERAERAQPDLLRLLDMGANQTRKWVEGTAMRRANRHMLRRNACVALGNSGRSEAVAPLSRVLAADPNPLVRGHAAWALGRLGARDALEQALDCEPDAYVRSEISEALSCRPAATGREPPER